ncbi:MAG: cysteine dioxygenase family protein [Planctomycetota bacterium]|jgi:cysteine dioxygenase|nr:cysteine dioxygenase family protein [Planctomycetota bacterium]
MLRGLVKLISYMDGLTAPAELAVVERLLREANVTREDMVVACKFNEVDYARNLLAQSPWYQLLVICWKFGQSSPIHDHPGSCCGVRVVDGVATETLFSETRSGFVKPVETLQHQKNDVCVTSDDDIHLITNEQSQSDLITLHLYSPPLQMSFYEPDEGFDFS